MAFNMRLEDLMMPALVQIAGAAGRPIVPIDAFFVFGSFLTNGASQPTAAGKFGHPFDVTRLSAGLYRISLGGATLKTGGYNVRKVAAFLPILGKGAAGSALRAHPGLVVENSGSGTLCTTLEVRLEDAAGAATDLAAATDNRVNWAALCIQAGK